MKLVTRLFITTSLLLAVAVGGLIVAADRLLRRYLVEEIAHGLQREAQLVALLLPGDSLAWPDAARALGERIGHRVTLIDSTGKVRGDTEFDRASLAQLENHRTRPEVRAAIGGRRDGIGRDERLSASTNERRLYVAVRGGPPGLAVVRVSTTLAVVDAQVGGVERAVALAGLTALLATALLAWLLSREVARPLVQLAGAARAIAAGQPPAFPQSRAPEVAQHILALRAMHEELDQRFTELRREREETATLIETMADGVLAADARGTIVTLNTAARRLLGYGPADRLPPLAELFHDKPARELVDAILSGREVEPVDLALDNRALLIAGRALPNGGALLVLRDVTDLRRLETVRRDFVANVSHELKTPLTSIAGYAETLTAEVGTGTQSERFAQTILSNARRMQRLVDDLLDLSRIESGGWQPTPESVDIAPSPARLGRRLPIGRATAASISASRSRRLTGPRSPPTRMPCGRSSRTCSTTRCATRRRAVASPSPPAPPPAARSSRYRTTGRGSRASICRGCSSGSTGRTPPAAAIRGAPVWGSRS